MEQDLTLLIQWDSLCLAGSGRGVPWEDRRAAFQLFRIREGFLGRGNEAEWYERVGIQRI